MGFRSPKGFKQYGDVSESVISNINDNIKGHIISIERDVYKEVFNSDGSRLVIFKLNDLDNSLNIKSSIYLDSVKSTIKDSEILTDIKYVTDFKEIMYIIYKYGVVYEKN